MKLPYLSHFRRADLNCLLFRFRSSFPVPIFLFAAFRSPLSAFRSPFPISLSSFSSFLSFSIPRYLFFVPCSSVPPFLSSCFLFFIDRSLFPVPYSLFFPPIFLSLFSVPCFTLPIFRFLFPILCSSFPGLCSLFSIFLFPVPCSLFSLHRSLFSLPLFSVACSLFPVFYFLFPVLSSLFSVLCFLFSVLCSPSLRSPAGSLFTIPRPPILIPSFFLFPKVKGNKERQTGRQTSPSSVGVGLHCWTFICCFIKTPLSTFASFVLENVASFVFIL